MSIPGFESPFSGIGNLRCEINSALSRKADIYELHQLKNEISSLRQEIESLRSTLNSFQGQIDSLRYEIKGESQ